MSNDTIAIAAVAVGAFLLLRKKTTVAQPGQYAANNSAWTNRYFQSPATAYYPTQAQLDASSKAQLVTGGFGVLSQLIGKWNSSPSRSSPASSNPYGNSDPYGNSVPDSVITNDAQAMPDYSSTDSGQPGDLGNWYG